MGLRAEPAEQGGYRYMHQSTGYSFEIRPSEGDATPEYEVLMPGQQEMLFVPLQLGHAAQVQICLLLLRSIVCGTLDLDMRVVPVSTRLAPVASSQNLIHCAAFLQSDQLHRWPNKRSEVGRVVHSHEDVDRNK